MVYNWKTALQSWLFPAHCRLCMARTRSAMPLCAGCHADLPWPGDSCRQCAGPLGSAPSAGRCGHCQRQPPVYTATTALLRYRPPADFLIQRLKFAGELALAPLLAGLLAARLAGRTSSLPELLVPVPLHGSRLRERGFNQATEIARVLGRTLHIPVNHRLCRRSRKTQTQSLLPVKVRHWNVRNAFAMTDRTPARHVAIVDDVMTTGHTVNELARILQGAGVNKIEVWVIARAGH